MKSNINNTGKTNPILKMAFSFVLICTFSFPALAQTDTLQYTEEIQQDSMVQYLTPLEYAFMMHEETPWMVKVNLILFSAFEDLKISTGFEHKISNSFTLNSELSYKRYFDDFTETSSMRFMLRIEPRWYYNMAKKVHEGKAKYNLSGNYISLGFGGGYELRQPNAFFGGPIETPLNLGVATLSAKWGIQRRFLKRGFMDFGLAVHYDFYPNTDISSILSFSTFINAGMAFANDKQKARLDREKLCSVLRCYAADRYLFKVNLISFMSLGVIKNKLSFSFNPEFAFEIKLGQSPFSINTDIRLNGINGSYIDSDIKSYFTFNAILEGRWYYNLKKRMLKGKTGNGLSANYFAFGGVYELTRTRFDKEFADSRYWKELHYNYSAGFQLVTGIQRSYSKHLYFDVNLGFTIYSYLDGEGFVPLGEFTGIFAVGYRF